jgi:hypothetical protein
MPYNSSVAVASKALMKPDGRSWWHGAKLREEQLAVNEGAGVIECARPESDRGAAREYVNIAGPVEALSFAG